MNRCTAITMSTQTLYWPTSPHPLPKQQHQVQLQQQQVHQHQSKTQLRPNCSKICHTGLLPRHRFYFGHGPKLCWNVTVPSERRVCCCYRECLSQIPPNSRGTLGGNKHSSQIHASKPNITKDETKALKDLRQEEDGVILTADKGWLW